MRLANLPWRISSRINLQTDIKLNLQVQLRAIQTGLASLQVAQLAPQPTQTERSGAALSCPTRSPAFVLLQPFNAERIKRPWSGADGFQSSNDRGCRPFLVARNPDIPRAGGERIWSSLHPIRRSWNGFWLVRS
jgi:hypothetical protein